MRDLRVLVVSSFGVPCGIADYADQLVDHLPRRVGIHTHQDQRTLDPEWCWAEYAGPYLPDDLAFHVHRDGRDRRIDLLWLNHHDGLHSRWTVEEVQRWQARKVKVVVTYHDTRSGEPGCENSEKARQLCTAADAFIVHEPVEDLPSAIVWRQGIPDPQAPWQFGQGRGDTRTDLFLRHPGQLILGTVGFNFPWKNYDDLCRITAAVGWALVICCANATDEDRDRWRGLNPDLRVVGGFQPQSKIVSYLSACDATAFAYTCANNGTSGAIRQGIAARKPVFAFEGCRQFRDLQRLDRDGVLRWPDAIDWVTDLAHLQSALECGSTTPPWMVHALAHQDAWTTRGQQYAQLFQEVCTRG